MAVAAESQIPPKPGWLRRIFGSQGLTLWQCATALLALAFAAERFATSLFYSHFGVALEEVGLGYANSLLEGVVLFIGILVLLNGLVIFSFVRTAGWCLERYLGIPCMALGSGAITSANNAGVCRPSSRRYCRRARLRRANQEGQYHNLGYRAGGRRLDADGHQPRFRRVAGLSLPNIRYLFWPLQLRARDCYRPAGRMTAVFIVLLASLRTTIRSRFELWAEILALRHQIAVLQRTTSKRPRLRPIDRLMWVLLSRVWPNWRRAMLIVTPATIVRWHRRAFAAYWRWNSRPRRVGRPAVAADIRALIRQMHQANPFWGAPRIHGELQKLGIDVAQATVAKYLGRRDGPASQSWRTFLANHVSQLASIDFFTVPTATFRVLFVFVVLSHDRRRIVHVNVTSHPTALWTAQQLREAWPWDTLPRFVIRDRDAVYGSDPQRTLKQMGIEEVLTAPRCPWQSPFVERVIGSIRRECLDHVIVWNERSLHRHLRRYLAYYHEWRTHLSLDRCARPPGHPTVSLWHDRRSPTRRRFASPLRTTGCLIVALGLA
jgi:putative transposase